MEISPDYIGFYLQVGISPILYLYIYIYIQPIIVEYLNIGIYRNMPNYIRNGIAVHSGTCAQLPPNSWPVLLDVEREKLL